MPMKTTVVINQARLLRTMDSERLKLQFAGVLGVGQNAARDAAATSPIMSGNGAAPAQGGSTNASPAAVQPVIPFGANDAVFVGNGNGAAAWDGANAHTWGGRNPVLLKVAQIGLPVGAGVLFMKGHKIAAAAVALGAIVSWVGLQKFAGTFGVRV